MADPGASPMPLPAASEVSRRWVLLASVGTGLLAAIVWPFAATPLPPLAHWIGPLTGVVAIANVLTFLLLMPAARTSLAMSVLAGGHLCAAGLAVGHALLFPGAILPTGTVLEAPAGAVGWNFLSWKVAFPLACLGSIAAARWTGARPRRRLVAAVSVLLSAGLVAAAMSPLLPPYFAGGGSQFPPFGAAINVASIALSGLAVLAVWTSDLRRSAIFTAVGVVLLVHAAGLALSVHGGSRFTLGWYAERVAQAVTALVLVGVLLRQLMRVQSLQRFHVMADAAPVLIWETDAAGATFLNKAYTDFIGRPSADLMRMGWAQFLHPDDAEGYVRQYRAAFGRQARFEAQFRFLRHDGEYRWLQSVGTPQRNAHGEFVGYVGSCSDITDLKRSEAILQRNEAWFRELADTAPTILWVTDAKGRCTFLSRRWADLTGQAPEASLGTGWLQPVHADDMDASAQEFGSAVREQRTFSLDYRVRRADGQYVWCVDMGEPRFAADGSFIGHVGCVVDITERKLAELQKDALSRELQAADRRKDDFLATLSHELRNPLAPLRTGVHLLARAGDEATLQRVVGLMGRQIDHLVRLVDDLMDVSRIAQGRLSLVFDDVDVGALLQDVAAMHRPAIERAGQSLVLDVGGAPLRVRADRARLQQVLSNLVANATRYSPRGATVALSARVGDGGSVRLQVVDDGHGIPPEHLETAFQRFSHLNRTLGRHDAGLGLGLSVVRSLVELHGGRVWAHSEGLGRGTTVTLELPASDIPVQTPPHVPVSDGEARPSVLVVDDNLDAGESLAELLRLDGHPAHALDDPARAFEFVATHRPDAVVLDLAMHGLSGYDVARQLRSDPATSGVRLIALSGHGTPADRERTRDAGFDAHLTKPADPAQLKRLLAAAGR